MESGLNKITKQYDTLVSKNSKQKEEIAKLKAQLAEYKSLNSRIRRVPQKKKSSDATKVPTEESATPAPTTPPPPPVAA
jgi:cell division septum initiation protein DivIVA